MIPARCPANIQRHALAEGERAPSDNALAGASFQGRHVASLAARLNADAK